MNEVSLNCATPPLLDLQAVGLVCQVEHIGRAGGNIVGGRLVSDLRLDQATGAVSAVVSRDREGNETVHEADAVVFAIGITGELGFSVEHRVCQVASYLRLQ